jgi:hypothetical protein
LGYLYLGRVIFFISQSLSFFLFFSLSFSVSPSLPVSLSLPLSPPHYLSLFLSSPPPLLSNMSLYLSRFLSRVPLIRFCQCSSLSSRDSDEAARVPRSGDRPGPPLQPRAPCALGPRSLSAHRTALEPAHERRGRALCLCDAFLFDPLSEWVGNYPLPLLTKLLLFLRKILTCLSFLPSLNARSVFTAQSPLSFATHSLFPVFAAPTISARTAPPPSRQRWRSSPPCRPWISGAHPRHCARLPYEFPVSSHAGRGSGSGQKILSFIQQL